MKKEKQTIFLESQKGDVYDFMLLSAKCLKFQRKA